MTLRELLDFLKGGPPEAEVMAEGTSRNYFPLVAIKSVEFSTWRTADGQDQFIVTLRATTGDHPEVTAPPYLGA